MRQRRSMNVSQYMPTPEIHLVDKLFWTLHECSLVSGIGESSLRKLVEDGLIDYLPVGEKKMVSKEALLRYYEAHKVKKKKSGKGEDEKNGNNSKNS